MKPIKTYRCQELYNSDIKEVLQEELHFLENFLNGCSGITRIYDSISDIPDEANLVWNCGKYRVFKEEYYCKGGPQLYIDLHVV